MKRGGLHMQSPATKKHGMNSDGLWLATQIVMIMLKHRYVLCRARFLQCFFCCIMKEASLRTRLSNSHGCRNLFWRIGELTVHGTFYSNTSTGLKHYIFDHVVSSFVNNIFLKAVYIREEFNSPRTASDIDMAAAILLC